MAAFCVHGPSHPSQTCAAQADKEQTILVVLVGWLLQKLHRRRDGDFFTLESDKARKKAQTKNVEKADHTKS